MAEPLGIKANDVTEASRDVVERLRRGAPYERSLLIFDNAEAASLAQLQPLIPTGGAAHVLITSRDREMADAPGMKAIDVDVFTRAESLAHLRRQLPDLDDHDADRLAETLGDLPIAVAMATSWLKETGIPVTRYIDQLNAHPEDLLGGRTPSGYPESVRGVWSATIGLLRQQSRAAVRLLEVCAFFGPEPISTRIIYSEEFTGALRDLDPALASEHRMIDRLMRDLSRFSLARIDRREETIQIHRLLRRLVQGDMTDEDRERTRRTVRLILAGMRPKDADIDDPRTWPDFRILWPHLEASGMSEAEEPETRRLMVDRVRFLSLRGQLDSALRLGERLRDLWDRQALRGPVGPRPGVRDRQPAPGHGPGRGVVGHRHGRLLPARRASSPAITCTPCARPAAWPPISGRWGGGRRRSSGTRRRIRPCNGSTATTIPHLEGRQQPRGLPAAQRPVLRRTRPRPEGARPTPRRRSVRGTRRRWSQRSTGVATCRDCGQTTEAANLLEPTLRLCVDELGDDAPTTLYAAKGLVVVHRRIGEHHAALERSEQLYEQFVEVFGEDAHDTMSCALNLACDELANGNRDRALERATPSLRAIPHTGIAPSPLVGVCQQRGRLPADGR